MTKIESAELGSKAPFGSERSTELTPKSSGSKTAESISSFVLRILDFYILIRTISSGVIFMNYLWDMILAGHPHANIDKPEVDLIGFANT